MKENRNKKDITAAELVHEVKNPLTTVKGVLQLLKPYLVMIEKDHYVDVAISEINRADELLNAYIDNNQSQTISSHVDVNTLLEEIRLLFERQAHVHQIKFHLELDTTNPTVDMGRNELKQVLLNIVKNAVESFQGTVADNSRMITLETIVQDNKVLINVSDTGSGMDSFTLEQLFTPFYTEKMDGTGLGLSVCKKMIEKNKGFIIVESTRGKGTTFQISLPSSLRNDK